MNYKTIYLAGPITGVTYNGCTEWREFVSDRVPNHVHTLSPMRGKEHLKHKEANGVIDDHYLDDTLASVKGINTRDYWDVQKCDLIFVNLLGATRVSIGTVMEIAWARAFDKPVICIMEDDNIHNHSMLNYTCGYIVRTMEEALDVLEAVICTDKELKWLEKERAEFRKKEKGNKGTGNIGQFIPA